MKNNWPDWEIYKRDRCTCVYCEFSGMSNFLGWRQLAIDHLIPVSRGGANTDDNRVVSCHRCNTLKGSFDPSDGAKLESVPPEMRRKLIEKVTQYLDIDESEERKDFDRMMSELQQRDRSVA
jgi:hypothetical protein